MDIRLPATLRGWLAMNLFLAAFLFIQRYLPEWLMTPFYWAIVLFVVALDDLVAIGKRNYLRLNESASDGSAESWSEKG